MVLLRTYDERSVVSHSQGRIRTDAIYWAMRRSRPAPSTHSRTTTGSFPSYRESAIGLLRGDAAGDDPLVVARSSGRPVEPGRRQPGLDLRPDRDAGASRGRAGMGKRLRGEDSCALTFFGDGATSEGAFHEGANFAAVMRAPVVLFCNNNQWAISTPVSAQTCAEALVDKAAGYGIPGTRVDGGDVLAVYEATRERSRGRAPARGRRSSRRSPTAPHRTRPRTTRGVHRSRTSRGGARERMPRPVRALPPTGRRARRRARAGDQGAGCRCDARGIAAAEAEPPADIGLIFEHALVDPPASFAHDLAELRRILGG